MTTILGEQRSDSQRDAGKYYKLLLALQKVTQEIQRESYADVDRLLSRLLPDLADGLSAEIAFVARTPPNGDGRSRVEFVAVYPDKILSDAVYESELLSRVLNNGGSYIGDPLGAEAPSVLKGLEMFGAVATVLVRVEAAGNRRVVGICNTRASYREPFMAADRKALVSLVELVATGARIGERRRVELEKVQQAAALMNADLKLDVLLPRVVMKAADIFGADAASLMEWDPSGEKLVIAAACGLSETYKREQTISRAVIEKVLAAQDDLSPIACDLAEQPFGDPVLIEQESLRTVLALPLRVGEDRSEQQLVGLLNIYSKGQPREFEGFQVELAQLFAHHAFIAIKNARSYESSSRQVERLSELLKASRHITEIQPVDYEVPEIMFNLLAVGYDIVVLYPYDFYRRVFLEPVCDTSLDRRIQVEPVKDKSTTWLLARTGPNRLLPGDPDLLRWVEPPVDGVTASGFLRLMHEGQLDRTVGLLFFHKCGETGFTAEEIQQTEELASQAQQAIYKTFVLQAVVDSLRRAMGFDLVVLRPYEVKEHKLGQFVVSGTLRQPSQHGIKPGSKVEQRVLEGPPSHFTSDSANDEHLGGAFVEREGIMSSGCVRLEVGKETVGMLFVNWRHRHEWDDDEKRAVELFANQAALAIWNSRLYQDIERRTRALERRNQHWQALHEASKAIAQLHQNRKELTRWQIDSKRTTVEFEADIQRKILDRILEQTVALFGRGGVRNKACVAMVQLYNEQTQTLAFKSVYPPELLGSSPREDGVTREVNLTQPPVGVTGRAVLEKKPRLVPNVEEDADYILFNATTQSEVAVPMCEGDRVIGVLSVESDQLAAFDEEDQQALVGLAELAVVAINNTELYQELGRRLRYLQGVSEALAAAGLRRGQLLQRILQKALEVTGCHFGSIQLVEGEPGQRMLRFEAAEPSNILDSLQQKVGRLPVDVDPRGITVRALRTNQAQLVPDVKDDADYAPFHPETRCELAVVLRGEEPGDPPLGVLNVEHSDPNGLDEEDQQLLIMLAQLAVIALERAAEAERRAAEAEKRSQAYAGALLFATAADIAHDVNRQVSNIRRSILRYLDREEVTGEFREALIQIRALAEEIALQELPDPPAPGEQVAVANVPRVDRVVGRKQASFARKYPQITWSFDGQCGDVKARIDEQTLDILLKHLLTNAAKSIPRQAEERRVLVKTESNRDIVRITIEDTGRGVPPDLRDRLFVGPTKEEGRGGGYGLFIVKCISAMYGGDVVLDWSELGKGSRFVLTIPAASPDAEQGELHDSRG